jgi:HSP20 family protein
MFVRFVAAMIIMLGLVGKTHAFSRLPLLFQQYQYQAQTAADKMLEPLGAFSGRGYNYPVSRAVAANIQDLVQIMDSISGMQCGESVLKNGRMSGYSCSPASTASTSMPIGLQDSEQKLELVLEVPGVKKEDLSITVRGDQLSIQAERLMRGEKEKRQMLRSVTLPEMAQVDGIEAQLTDGVLVVTIPKKLPEPPVEVKIAIK